MTVYILIMATPSWPWGRDGHRVVAKISTKNLNPDIRAKLAAILGVDDAGLEEAMASAATWPDEISKPATGTGNWHFIDVPVFEPFSLAGLCDQHDCVIDRIKEMSDRLRSNATDFQLKQPPSPTHPIPWQELAFLIHFVGDIHQPLHAATNGDRGGNCVQLTTPISHSPFPTTELHAAWDFDEVQAVYGDLGKAKPDGATDEDSAATQLFQAYKGAGRGDWESEPVETWAQESNVLAKADAYDKLGIPQHTAAPGKCAAGIDPVSVDQAYLDGNVPDVEQQLMRAGIRLSDILNQICTGDGCAAALSTNNPPTSVIAAMAAHKVGAATAQRTRLAQRTGHHGNAGEFMPAEMTKSSGCAANGPYPDADCTPGAVMGITVDEVCNTGTKGRRAVTTGMKRQVFAEYGISYPQPKGAYEVDHFIPLELGGSNDVANIWPELAKPTPGFHEKDLVENALHNEVCKAHTMTLEEAQRVIVADWLQYYRDKLQK